MLKRSVLISGVRYAITCWDQVFPTQAEKKHIMQEKRPITRQGYNEIKAKIQQLVSVERPKIAQEIAEARAHGDLKENAEYHSAKDKQGLIEATLKSLNSALQHAEIIEKVEPHGKVVFGAKVRYTRTDSGDEFVWQLVGPDEADFKQNKISVSSPIGRAILGKEVGDVLQVQVPKGQMEIEILDVE